MKNNNITFIGLGAMGAPMAGHVSSAGYQTTVFNRSSEKSLLWAKTYKGVAADSISAAVSKADIVLLCLGDDASVESTLLGQGGVFAAVKKGTIIVDHTTTSAVMAEKLSETAQTMGLHFLDAPVSGGEVGAVNGKLTVMVGGDAPALSQAKPVIECYAQAVTLMGESGSGQLTKMVNQICIAGLVQALSEGLAFSQKAGLDSKRVLEVISKGAAQSWQMENRGNTMLDGQFQFGFAVDHMRKDLGLVIDQAQKIDANIPIAKIVDQYYADVQGMGGARWDTSALIKRLM